MIAVVTDRRRRDVVEQTSAAAAAGIDFVIVRERDLDGGPLHELTSAAVRAARGSATRVLVNDRLDVALASGAGGVHLRADSMPASAVRALAPRPFLVGRSVHGADEAREAGPDVDFLIAGTVFPTASKPDVTDLLGLDGLRDVCEAASVPVLAIGGITEEQLDAVRAAGASGIAGIGWFDGSVPFESIQRAVALRFDTAKSSFLR